MDYNTWFARTGRDTKKRSAKLLAIDKALQAFVGGGRNVPNLKKLESALLAWQESKRSDGNEGWRTTRHGADVIRELAVYIGQMHIDLHDWPAPEAGYGPGHNCYAYAMKCPDAVAGNNARPGREAGNGRGWSDTAPSPAGWKADLIAAVKNDAKHGNQAIISSTPDSPLPVPATVAGDNYLVALLGNQTGYHFMRRNEQTKLWSHKNGSISNVETTIFNATKGRCFVLDDKTVAEMIMDPLNWDGVNNFFGFIAWLSVPYHGITVRG